MYSEPRADGFVLFDRQGQRNHNSTVAEAHISYPDRETLSDEGARGAMRSSSRWSDLRSTCLHIPQSLGLASAESAWWPGSPCRAQCYRPGEWAAAKRRDTSSSPLLVGWNSPDELRLKEHE